MAQPTSITWNDANTLRLTFDKELDASSTPGAYAFSVGGRSAYCFNAAIKGKELFLTLESDYAAQLRANGTAISVSYATYDSNDRLCFSTGAWVGSFTASSLPWPSSVDTKVYASDVFIARSALGGSSYALNNILSDVVARNICVTADGSSASHTLTLTTDYGSFMESSPYASASADGKTITVTGTQAQITAALQAISLRTDSDLTARAASGASLLASVRARLDSGDAYFHGKDYNSTQKDVLHIFAEDVQNSSFFLKGGTEYAYINSVRGLSQSSFSANSYTNTGVIDAEKSPTNYSDDRLCWAATAANMLTWAGYGDGLGSGNELEDRVFREFWSNFSDKGSYIDQGVSWFFTGRYDLALLNPEEDGAQPFSAYSGNYIGTPPQVSLATLYTTNNASERVDELASALFAGEAVGLSISGSDSHAITCWGLTFDASKSRDNPNWLTGIYITDSDDDKYITNPQDTLRYVRLSWNGTHYDMLGYSDFGYHYWGGGFTTLARKDSLQEDLGQHIRASPDVDLRHIAQGERRADLTVSGGDLYASGGAAYFTKVTYGGKIYAYSGGSAMFTDVHSGGMIYAGSGGVARHTTVLSGGSAYTDGGVASNTTVMSGGKMEVAGGAAINSYIEEGAEQYVWGIGVASNTKLSGVQDVNGEAHSTVICAGGRQVLNPDSVASNTTVTSGGLQYLLFRGTARATTVVNGGVFSAAAGAVVSGLTLTTGARAMLAGGNTLYAANTFTGATVTGGTRAAPVRLANTATLTLGGKNTMTSFHLAPNAGHLNVTGAANKLASLNLAAKSRVTYDVSKLRAAGNTLMLQLSAKNTQKRGRFSISVGKAQNSGVYELSKNITQKKGTAYTVKLGSTKLGTVKLGGGTLTKNGATYKLVAKGAQINLTVGTKRGKMLKGNAGANTLKGASHCDIFYGGKGNDKIYGGNGRDVAIYNKTHWGKDIIAKTNGAMTLLFTGLKASDIVQRTSGKNLVITRKGAAGQSITIQGYNAATHKIVFGSGLKVVDKYLAAARPTTAQANAARNQIWKKAGLA